MDYGMWTVAFSAMGFALALIIAVCTFVYFILRLVTNPIKEDVEELKKAISDLTRTINILSVKVKSDMDISNMIKTEIAENCKNCPNRKTQ